MATESQSNQVYMDTDLADAIDIPGYDATLEWTTAEERQAIRKCDTFILPFIMLLFCFLQFDRTNIANALTDTLRTDLNIGNPEINIAQTLFIVGFIITEIPFNMISKLMGPERFLPITMFLWGIVTWCQTFMTSASGLYACRFFVGALEGGYIPGMALYISKWYTNEELGLRYACFWASNSIAGMLSGPLSIGLISLRGRGGLAGWQWLFLIGKFKSCEYNIWLMIAEGLLTCALAVVGYFYLPHSAARPKSFFGRSFKMISHRQASIIVTRVIRSDPQKASRHGKPVLPKHILETFMDWRLYGHILSAFLSM